MEDGGDGGDHQAGLLVRPRRQEPRQAVDPPAHQIAVPAFHLAAGLHTLTLEYSELTGASEIHLRYSCANCSPGLSDQVIPASDPNIDPARRAEARDEWDTVVKAINTLTEEQRQVLIGRLILGYDVATVARMIGKNANAVKALQFRALHSLQRLLSDIAIPLY